ncbi:DUF2634 domain-containing protein [Peptostreptococcus canis]|uniref:DUF2634 domain-containing protein n=1 Tax=Peptostreptococcus canis TaxID=1159213 RepID=A0ABR6TME0_9FIRM|nr:DUF2634 domain-containing protein [Peptostreptococcus canis]MBC2576586.1 DUF2634 domain-containing protein [Peptostreptococcus canis]MBP1998773.1 hypothetical protein [Peptostreptococcus canis]
MTNNFPFVGEERDYIINQDKDLPVPYEIAINFENGEILRENDDIKIVKNLEAIKVWVYLAILTQRYKHQIFSSDYGCEHTNLIGSEYTKELTESEAYRYIEECLLANPYIEKVKNLGVFKKGNKLEINIEIFTSFGNEVMNIES